MNARASDIASQPSGVERSIRTICFGEEERRARRCERRDERVGRVERWNVDMAMAGFWVCTLIARSLQIAERKAVDGISGVLEWYNLGGEGGKERQHDDSLDRSLPACAMYLLAGCPVGGLCVSFIGPQSSTLWRSTDGRKCSNVAIIFDIPSNRRPASSMPARPEWTN